MEEIDLNSHNYNATYNQPVTTAEVNKPIDKEENHNIIYNQNPNDQVNENEKEIINTEAQCN